MRDRNIYRQCEEYVPQKPMEVKYTEVGILYVKATLGQL